MPITEGIIVPITADAKGLADGMNLAKKSIFSLKLEQEKYENMAFTEKNTLRLIEYNRKIQQLQTEVKQLTNIGKEGFDKFGNAVSGGNNMLTKGYGLIRQMAYILPGIGVAGIIGFATEPLVKYLSSLTGISEAAKKAKKEQDDFNKSLDQSVGAAMKSGFELKAYIALAADTTKSLTERNKALSNANKLYGEHSEKLSLTNIDTKKVKEQVEGYTQALIANAVAAKYGDKIADGYFKQREAAREYGQELDKLKALEKGYREGLKNNGGFDISEGGATQDSRVRVYQVQYAKAVSATEKYRKVTKGLTIDTSDYVDVLQKAVELSSRFGQPDTVKPIKELKGKKEEKEERQPEKLKGRFLGGAYDRVRLDEINASLRALKATTKDLGQAISEESNAEANAMMKANAAALRWRDTLKEIGLTYVPIIQNSFQGMFDSLLSGGGKAISTITQSIGQLIKKLISAALAAATMSAILGIATGGGSTIGSFLNLTAKGQGFGSIFKGLFGGIVGHASGGITNKPHLAMVGEGKEREVITPLSQLKNIIGNVGGSRAMPVPQLYMKGSDMWIMWQRQQLQNQRNY